MNQEQVTADSTFSLFGKDLFSEDIKPQGRGPLAERFEWPPFSVLSARDGEWQERKRAWLSTGIQSEIGRGGMAKAFNIGLGATPENKWKTEDSKGSGTSIFDPVLCELIYRWFCPLAGTIVDPFAGGSVRGIVAGLLGYRYCGIDLSEKQIVANKEQQEKICPTAPVAWVQGDALEVLKTAIDQQVDFIFSCPPYGDLERYSDDPRDLSTMEYHTFIANYKRIILRCAKILKPGCFACFVVGDFRDKRTGNYRGFVADTIIAFRDVGLQLYNDAVLVTAIGSLPIRVSAQFENSRKLGKTHQNVLVFVKGERV